MNLFKVFKYPKTCITLITLISAFFAWHLPKLAINNDVVIFLPENNPHRRAFDALKEQFGKTDGIIIAATVRNGTIADSANVAALMKMTDEFKQIDSVEEVTSLVSADFVQGVQGGLETFPVVREVPTNSAEESAIIQRLRSWDIYENTLYTEDLKTSMILIKPFENSIKQDESIYYAVQQILEDYQNRFDFRTAGFPAVFVLVGRNMNHDLMFLIPFVIIVVILTLWYSFRNIGGVVLPLLTVLISTVWSLGLMSVLGVEMTLIATVVPVLLVAVGSAYGIHIMSHYYDEYREACSLHEKSMSSEVHESILEKTLSGVGRPVMMAALTTMIGFGSLASSRIVPVRDFGIFTAVGVFSAFIISVTLIPSILHFYSRKNTARVTSKNSVIEAVLRRLVKASHYPRAVIISTILISLVAIAGATRVRVGSAIINFFKQDSSLWKANTWLQEKSNGTVTLSVIIQDNGDNTLTHPTILNKIDTFGEVMTERFSYVKKVGSLADLIKRMNEVMHVEEKMADSSVNYYEIPYDPAKYGFSERDALQQLIVQYLMLFSGDVETFADDALSPSRLRILMQMNTNDMDSLSRVRTAAAEWMNAHFPDGYEISIAGTADAEIEVNNLIVHSQTASILISLIIVFAVLALYYRSIGAGALGMLCLGIPLLLNFGAMGLLGIHLDIATAMISSIAIGIGIDYIIHFIDGYARELKKNAGKWEDISTRTIMGCGKAIVFNAVSVALGFAVILFSNFKPLNHLGGLIFFTMLSSSLVSLTLLPVILNHMKPAFLLKYHTTAQKGVRS